MVSLWNHPPVRPSVCRPSSVCLSSVIIGVQTKTAIRFDHCSYAFYSYARRVHFLLSSSVRNHPPFWRNRPFYVEFSTFSFFRLRQKHMKGQIYVHFIHYMDAYFKHFIPSKSLLRFGDIGHFMLTFWLFCNTVHGKCFKVLQLTHMAYAILFLCKIATFCQIVLCFELVSFWRYPPFCFFRMLSNGAKSVQMDHFHLTYISNASASMMLIYLNNLSGVFPICSGFIFDLWPWKVGQYWSKTHL